MTDIRKAAPPYPNCEPTVRGDICADEMREVYEANKPLKWWQRRKKHQEWGSADNLMLRLQSVVHKHYPPAPSEPICETCGFATSHPNASFCSDGFHQPALDPYTLENAAKTAVHIGKTQNGFTYEGYAGTIADAIRALIPTSEGDAK